MPNQHHTTDSIGTDFGLAGMARMPFGCLVRCADCRSSRPMVIKALRPAMVGDTDHITYRCTACGAERTEPASQRSTT